MFLALCIIAATGILFVAAMVYLIRKY